MAKKRKVPRPQARLEARPGDAVLTDECLSRMSIFKEADFQDFYEYPGTVILRKYRQGEEICVENDPGFTAFYILTSQEICELENAASGPSAESAAPDRAEGEDVAKVTRNGAAPAFLKEGELFGEMSCLDRLPRSATVTALRDCQVLEMMRNILEIMMRNRDFATRLENDYRERFLETHLRELPLFCDLPEKVFDQLRKQAKLDQKAPGDLICDEHDVSDCMYVIRMGFVKVLKNASALLGEAAIPDWRALCQAMVNSSAKENTPGAKLWELLGTHIHPAIQEIAEGASASNTAKQTILAAINKLLKTQELSRHDEFQALVRSEGPLTGAPSEKWSWHQKVRLYNRKLVQAVLPNTIASYDPDGVRTLAYRSELEMIGERGLVMNEPRRATCIAYDHDYYKEESLKKGRVKLVCIPRSLFEQMCEVSPELQAKVHAIVDERDQETKDRLALPIWDERNSALLSDRIQELGLIQGQKLMLIDLDRCTRCDECVKACVDTHTPSMGTGWFSSVLPKKWYSWLGDRYRDYWYDGPEDERSRLFLDGPRFQVKKQGQLHNYLVPSTCRQCRDPICLVGCPVGSIHKGDNGQIVIEDWCVGCRTCAQQCPYGSIQMHTVGIVPRGSRGWSFRRQGKNWHQGDTPFLFDETKFKLGETVSFRYAFELDKENDLKSFLFTAASSGSPVVKINGTAIGLKSVKKSKNGVDWNLETDPPLQLVSSDGTPDVAVLRIGGNLIEIEAKAREKPGDILLDVGLLGIKKPSVIDPVEELVLQTAVVCDLCSGQIGKQPACVSACPHDAASRIDVNPKTIREWTI